jgi:hypothetical protein
MVRFSLPSNVGKANVIEIPSFLAQAADDVEKTVCPETLGLIFANFYFNFNS